jgi:MoxR-like ATPase
VNDASAHAALASPDLKEVHGKLSTLRQNLSRVIRGKSDIIELLVTSLLAGGSVLMEDVPGVGKTTLAKALAKSLDAQFRRIQFTPDLLPTDILGASVYRPIEGAFTFTPGPIFCNILLADEINRASPRTQSALLEAMSEGQVTIDGERRPLPTPFLVLATQNPVDFHGTYPLPEAQLDRFLMQLGVGYPDKESEVEILFEQALTQPIDDLQAVLILREVVQLQQSVGRVHVDRSIATYIVELVRKTREHPLLKLGVSPRGSLMFFRAVQAAAIVAGRDYVIPDDVRNLAGAVLSHRVMLSSKAKYGSVSKRQIIDEVLAQLPVPV